MCVGCSIDRRSFLRTVGMLVASGAIASSSPLARAAARVAGDDPLVAHAQLPIVYPDENVTGYHLGTYARWLAAWPNEPDYGEDNVDLATPGKGTATIEPNSVPVDTVTDFTITFTAGAGGLRPGGGVRWELRVGNDTAQYPVNWTPPQANDPSALGYTSVRGPSGALFQLEVDGRLGMVVARLIVGTVRAGDTVRFTYRGNPTPIADPFALHIQEKEAEGIPWRNIARPTLHRIPGPATVVILVAPGDIVVGEPFTVKASALDRYGNLATGFNGVLALDEASAAICGVGSVVFTEGRARIDGCVASDPGYHVLRASPPEGARIYANAFECWASTPSVRRFFGDTHFHTGQGLGQRGFRGMGTLEGGDHRAQYTDEDTAYDYLRTVQHLDFASATEHSMICFQRAMWEATWDIADRWNAPGEFTTFYGYEYTSITEGHRIVLFRERGGLYAQEVDPRFFTLAQLYAGLLADERDAIVIPHMQTSVQYAVPNWNVPAPTLQRLAEIYSHHSDNGAGPGGDRPRAKEGHDRGAMDDPDDSFTLQYGWSRGHRFGVVATSDNHVGNPGVKKFTLYTGHAGGYTAVLASENTRDALWRAHYGRHTYATTGLRALLRFTVNGAPMGSEIVSAAPPLLAWSVCCGEADVRTIEIVRLQDGAYEVIHVEQPRAFEASGSVVDTGWNPSAMYYLRVTFERFDPAIFENMAWSSPVWVDAPGVVPTAQAEELGFRNLPRAPAELPGFIAG